MVKLNIFFKMKIIEQKCVRNFFPQNIASVRRFSKKTHVFCILNSFYLSLFVISDIWNSIDPN